MIMILDNVLCILPRVMTYTNLIKNHFSYHRLLNAKLTILLLSLFLCRTLHFALCIGLFFISFDSTNLYIIHTLYVQLATYNLFDHVFFRRLTGMARRFQQLRVKAIHRNYSGMLPERFQFSFCRFGHYRYKYKNMTCPLFYFLMKFFYHSMPTLIASRYHIFVITTKRKEWKHLAI